jgi:hypothetical protein
VLLPEAQEKFPSQLHVIAWLLEAGRLVVSPYGVLFDAEQLGQFSERLRGKLKPGEPVPTGLLKEQLGLGRRKATALRDVFNLRPWLILPPSRKPQGQGKKKAQRPAANTAAAPQQPTAKRSKSSQRPGDG